MKKIFTLTLLFSLFQLTAQNFTRRDSLQGGMRFERSCYDVQHYDLNIKINPEEKSIVGYNEVTFDVLQDTKKIQLDLFENMNIDSIVFNKKKLTYKRDNDAVFISFASVLPQNSSQKLRFYYSGKPLIAKNAPWDGGFVFKKDKSGKDFIAVAVQGTGASLWYPVKDSQTDEPDKGATIKVAVPNGLMDVSNGRFKGSEDLKNGYTRWDWEVVNPINTYSITVNIADYAHIHDNLNGLDLDYYVLRENEEIAKVHFEADVKPMMNCFQEKFGQYPFYEDGYKLVETPYLGMEHQSCVTYGNGYRNGYLGSDLSGTGWGLKFDFIIIHESGHEWFANNITYKDIADMWIHESFTCYSESLFLEYYYEKYAGSEYLIGLRKNIQNDKPIIGHYDVNNEGSGDMYYKGANMLHTLRQLVNDDEKWRTILRGLNSTFYHQTVTTKQIEDYLSQQTGMDLNTFFNQYLRDTRIPTLEYSYQNSSLKYRWINCVKGFEMPVKIFINDSDFILYPKTEWTEFISPFDVEKLEVDTNFYVLSKKITQ
jgi:aminopeptidase N